MKKSFNPDFVKDQNPVRNLHAKINFKGEIEQLQAYSCEVNKKVLSRNTYYHTSLNQLLCY